MNVLVITGVGAVSPVGLSAPATCAALRAGIARMEEFPPHPVAGELFDEAPVVAGRVPMEWFQGGPVEESWPAHERFALVPPPEAHLRIPPGPERLIQLAIPALREALSSAEVDATRARVGLYLGLGQEEDVGAVVEGLRMVLGDEVASVQVSQDGRAAGLLALGAARDDLVRGAVQLAVVGGVDSLLRAPVLDRLEASGGLRSGESPQGVIPGEAACFLVAETFQHATSRGGRPSIGLRSLRAAAEPTVASGEPNRAEALSQVLRSTVQESGLGSLPLILCDLNGERYRATEWAMASVRAFPSFHEEREIWHPADCTGDVGAASGPLNIAWAMAAFQRGYAERDAALIWCASDGPMRAAAVFTPV